MKRIDLRSLKLIGWHLLKQIRSSLPTLIGSHSLRRIDLSSPIQIG